MQLAKKNLEEEEVKVMGRDLQKLTLCDSLVCYVLAVNYQEAKTLARQLHSDCDSQGDKSQKLHRVYSTYRS